MDLWLATTNPRWDWLSSKSAYSTIKHYDRLLSTSSRWYVKVYFLYLSYSLCLWMIRSSSELSKRTAWLHASRRNLTCDRKYHCKWDRCFSFSLFTFFLTFFHFTFFFSLLGWLLKTKLLLTLIYFDLCRKWLFFYLQRLLHNGDWRRKIEKKLVGIWLGIFWEWSWFECILFNFNVLIWLYSIHWFDCLFIDRKEMRRLREKEWRHWRIYGRRMEGIRK